MCKKYEVFVSSTLNDLKEERKKVIDMLLWADCIPASMETFAAADIKQFEVIKGVIDLCDYYVLILGRRYGTINPDTGISYTEMEYDYAFSKGIPILVFALDSSVEISSDKIDTDVQKLAKLEVFRAKAMANRMASIWCSIDDLALRLLHSIMNAKIQMKRPGWHRGTDYDKASLQKRIIELEKENQRLQEDLERQRQYEQLKNNENNKNENRKYLRYEGKWIQYLPDFSRAIAICRVQYSDGIYHFTGVNYYPNDKEKPTEELENIRFNSLIIEKSPTSFYYITDAHESDHLLNKIHGFGEVQFEDKEIKGAYTGLGYFYDVDSAKGNTREQALQNFILIKHDKLLYERIRKNQYLGVSDPVIEDMVSKSDEEIDRMPYDDIYAIVKDRIKDCLL